MKTLKKASQKNIKLNKSYYSENEIKTMLKNEVIFYLNNNFEYSNLWENDAVEFRIATDNLKEIKVVLEDGYYTTVAIGLDNIKYYVNL